MRHFMHMATMASYLWISFIRLFVGTASIAAPARSLFGFIGIDSSARGAIGPEVPLARKFSVDTILSIGCAISERAYSLRRHRAERNMRIGRQLALGAA